MPDLSLLVNRLQLAAKDRTKLAFENIALGHQLAVYNRTVKRPNIDDGEAHALLARWQRAHCQTS